MRIFLALSLMLSVAFATRQPNIVFVITDDQGYGDLGFTGNPVIKTPHIDKLIKESVWLEDYHVAPTCSPTRSSLLTGHWTDRTGVWHTINGRSMLRENEVTLPDYLSKAGYQTGIFGKWHLGDNYPYRPEDRGFTHTFYHAAGGIGQTPDSWNNDYFDDQYHKNGQLVKATGYCTDVFFDEASQFIRECAEKGKPFFSYISTNAPHGPLSVPQEYMDHYKGKEGVEDDVAAFFGMIENIDDNVGKLRDLLVDLEISDDTIFIFTTDNGTATGQDYYNAGMRGKKGTEYEGGHRVPFTMHWPYYGLDSHKVVKELTHAVDIVPTLLDLCEYELDGSEIFDGVTLDPLIGDTSDASKVDWKNRIVVTDSQRVVDPIKWKQTSVMSGKWRLVNNTELYHVGLDPDQSANIIEDYPRQAQRLREFYDAWWAELEPTFSQTTEIYIGHNDCPVVELNAHDWIQGVNPPWNQSFIREGQGFTKGATHDGHWAVKVINSGEYEISVSRWPIHSGIEITKEIEAMPVVPGYGKNYSAHTGISIPIESAVLRINGKEIEQKPVTTEDKVITFKTTLKAGSHKFSPFFNFSDKEKGAGQIGTYYCEVKPVQKEETE